MKRRPFLAASGLLALSLALLIATSCAGGTTPVATTTPAGAAATLAPAATSATTPTRPAVTPTGAASPTEAGTAAPTKAASPAATVEAETAGQELYETNCSACHGANGAGGLKVGNSTAADLRSPELESTYNNDDALVSRAILQGIDQKGDNLDTEMPRFQGKLSQQQVNQIIAYLKTLHQ